MAVALENDKRVVIRAPRGTMMAIERIAISAHVKPAELARRLLLEGLKANGFYLARPEVDSCKHYLQAVMHD